jgi:hypothetical protein
VADTAIVVGAILLAVSTARGSERGDAAPEPGGSDRPRREAGGPPEHAEAGGLDAR